MNAEVTKAPKTSGRITKNKNKMLVAEFLTLKIDAIVSSGEKTQKEIAAELGYPKPNIITMFKQGLTNLPLNKVGMMAKAINVDPGFLMRMVMSEYMPETYTAIEEAMDGLILSNNEKLLVQLVRENLGGDKDLPNMFGPEVEQKVADFVKTL
jgi:predicted XRE-type DNA-binding protein